MSKQEEFRWLDVDCFSSLGAPICQWDGTTPTIPTIPTTTIQPTTTDPSHYVTLVGGGDESEGNVFARNRNGHIGPVCDDGWSTPHANVVCRQLGYSSGNYTRNSHFGISGGDVFAMDTVECEGDEQYIQDCSYVTVDDCSELEAAGVICF